MSDFQVGDKIVCVDTEYTFLQLGATYEVEETTANHVKVRGYPIYYKDSRFKRQFDIEKTAIGHEM